MRKRLPQFVHRYSSISKFGAVILWTGLAAGFPHEGHLTVREPPTFPVDESSLGFCVVVNYFVYCFFVVALFG